MKDTFDIAIFSKYAEKRHPEKLPKNLYFHHTKRTVTVFDEHPKSLFHFLLIPRLGEARSGLTKPNLVNLQVLLNSPEVSKADAFKLLSDMKEDALEIKEKIEAEMMDRFEFKWDIWMGFHAAPSMEYVFTVLRVQKSGT